MKHSRPAVHRGVLLAIAATLAGCANNQANLPPARSTPSSLMGRAMPAPKFDEAERARLEADLLKAQENLVAQPESEDAAIWVGRRLGYLQRYNDAIDAFTEGLKKHPDSYRLLRHRGHRFITVRRFDLALADLSRAWSLARNAPDTVEPDGAPTEGVPPRGTDKSSILYHLGLVKYLMWDYAGCVATFRESLALPTTNDDNRVSATYWMYLSLRAEHRDAQAAALLAEIRDGMDVRENTSYYALLKAYKAGALPKEMIEQAEGTKNGARGETIDNATIGYGVGEYLVLSGETDRGREILRNLAYKGPWAGFGTIAAESRVARQR